VWVAFRPVKSASVDAHYQLAFEGPLDAVLAAAWTARVPPAMIKPRWRKRYSEVAGKMQNAALLEQSRQASALGVG